MPREKSLEGVEEQTGPTLTRAFLDNFRDAVKSSEPGENLPTLATIFREAEYCWLKRLGVDLKDLLHVDQIYEYVEPFQENDSTYMATRVVRYRERTSGSFLVLQTDISGGSRRKCISTTTFMIRGKG